MSLISYLELETPSDNDWIELFSDQKVRRHMPLSNNEIDSNWIRKWLESKKKLSRMSIFEINSVWVAGRFAGWAGIQPDGKDFELAIVLKSEFWGHGKEILLKFLRDFHLKKPDSYLLIYLPKSRNSKSIINRFNLNLIGTILIEDYEFDVIALNSRICGY